MEEGSVTQRVRIKTGPRTTSKTSMNTNHTAHMANGPNISRLLSYGILKESGLQEQFLGYLGPDESVTWAMKAEPIPIDRRLEAEDPWMMWSLVVAVHSDSFVSARSQRR